jgi:hypothetical protein
MAITYPKRTSDQLRDLKVGGRTGYIEIETVVDTSAYVSGDVLFPTTAIPLALDEAFGTGIIHSIILLDKNDQAGALDLLFLRTDVSIGAANAAVNFSDTIADEIVGVVEIVAGDYVDLVNSQIVCKTNLGIGFQGDDMQKLYVAAISRDTKTYSAANSITLKITILQD